MLISRDARGRARRQQSRDKAVNEDVHLFDNLTGGVDLTSSPTMIPPHKARTLKNWSLSEPAALVTLPGWRQFSEDTLGTERVQGGKRIYLGGASPFTVVAYNGEIYKPDDTGAWGSSLLSGLSTANEIHFEHDRQVVQVFDGTTRPKISPNGDDWYDSGIDAPSVAPIASLIAGVGLISGNEYEVAYTYATTAAVHAGLVTESNGSATDTETPSGGNLQIRVTVEGTDDPKVNKINIYARNLTTGQTVLRRMGQIDNPGAGNTDTFDITVEPNELSLEIPSDHDVPPATLSFAVFWRNRWWALDSANRNRLHFSQAFEPQTWPADFYLDLPMERGDEAVTLVALGDTLTVWGQTGCFLVIGQTSLDFDVRAALMAETGAFGPRAAVRVEGGIFHAGVLGAFLFDGATDVRLSRDIEKGWRDLITSGTPAALARVSVNYNGKDKQVSVAVPRLYPTGTVGEYILDVVRTQAEGSPAWSTSDRDIVGYIGWNGDETSTGNTERLFSWGTVNGILYEERVGADADGNTFIAEFEGPTFTSQLRETIVVQGFIEFQPADGELIIELVCDSQVVSSQTIDLGVALSLYDVAQYGTAVYGGADRIKLPLMWPLDAEGSTVAVKIRFQGTSLFRLFSYGFSMVPEGVPRSL